MYRLTQRIQDTQTLRNTLVPIYIKFSSHSAGEMSFQHFQTIYILQSDRTSDSSMSLSHDFCTKSTGYLVLSLKNGLDVFS